MQRLRDFQADADRGEYCLAAGRGWGIFPPNQFTAARPTRDPTLKIESDTVVTFHYTLRNEAGTELESSRGSEPSVYLHGANNVIRGLESAMAGREKGDVFTASLSPVDAYGLHNPGRVQRVPVKHLAFRVKLAEYSTSAQWMAPDRRERARPGDLAAEQWCVSQQQCGSDCGGSDL